MNLRLLISSILIVVLAQAVHAEERYLDFVRGLRERGYFDYAILYLDQLGQRASVPDDVRQVLTYEKAVTLRESAKALRNPEKQQEQLDQALAYLEQFVREHPDHPRTADANSDRAQILLQKADVEIFQSKSPANKGSKLPFQRRGRELVAKARDVLKTAFDQHDAALKKYPVFIDEQKEPTQYAEREAILGNLVHESLSLAKCTYQEAQTYDATAREFKQLLGRAADEFETVHQKYRTYVGGLTARAWQGKCFEEQGDLQKALGIYNELLEHPGDNPSLRSLKSQTLQFKLICLYARSDYQLAIDLAEDWQKKNATDSRTSVGLGIQWEEARAYEALGDNRSLPKPDQERYWRQARTVAQQINRFPGEYKDVSLAMMQRMQTKLGGKERKPEDFDAAYGLGRQAFNSAMEVRKELDEGTKSRIAAEDLARLQQDWKNLLSDAERNLELSLALANRRDSLKDISTARLLLAHTKYHLHQNYEAAILAQYIARTSKEDDTSIAIDAAHMAMAAFVQEYNEHKVEPERKMDDMWLIIKAANLITDRWPESERANEARMVLGGLYRSAKQPIEAAQWFSKVPESDPKFPEAQLSAGQAFWAAYGAATRQTPTARPTTEILSNWKASAETYLKNGIARLSATLPVEGSVPQELVSAKIYLAEILLNQGQEAAAAKLLKDDPQSVVKAITVEDESVRPEKGIQSRSVAKSVYTLLLRADIGMGADKLNDARQTMQTLEAIAAGDTNSDLTDLYVGLGRMLKTELERFRSNGETARFEKLREAFESFLDDMSKKQEGQTIGSLSWIGETFIALGEIATDHKKSASYYDRAAAAFQGIFTRAEKDPSFATPDQLLNVKVRLIRCLRFKRSFPDAEKLLTEVLKARGNDLRTQMEGASVYQDWGKESDPKKFIVAIVGQREIGLWGWGGIAKRIQQQKNFSDRPEMVEAFLDARYNVSACRFEFAKGQPAAEKQKTLELCAMELVGSASIMKSLPDEQREKLNRLYRDTMKELGRKVVDLPRNEEIVSALPADKDAAEASPHSPKQQSSTETVAPNATAARSMDSTTWMMFLGCVIAGIVVFGAVIQASRKPKPKSKSSIRRAAAAASTAAFTGIAVDDEDTPAFSFPSTPKPRPKPEAKPSSPPSAGPAQTSPSRPATRPEGQVPAPKPPRPRPPSPPRTE
ncbi:P-loop NTPase family protein [Schlesneria paludicola]|uniref:tetratricopeptide repeat protein n=1 Tax=Schlesneria paludicola TaxID=360056 RepID=UPI00030FAFCB|nr:tetratricopeptide repeat protein [Schlesneria paludicola]